jgi:hypothetical protein
LALKLKMHLPGDFEGGLGMFLIIIGIALVELYIVKKVRALQVFKPGTNPVIAGQIGGGLGGLVTSESGAIISPLAECERKYKGNKDKIEKCKDALTGAEKTEGGNPLSPEEKMLYTQARQ